MKLNCQACVKNWGVTEMVLAAWAGSALVILVPATRFLQAAFPIFTVIWLAVPLLVLLRSQEASRVGVRRISWRALWTTTVINLGALLAVVVLFEPWSHAYGALIKAAVAGTPPDTTFAWLVRFEGWSGWAGMLLFSGGVTIFAEELFFRGWLLGWLQRRMGKWRAIALQAVFFTLPQLLAAVFLSPMQGMVYAVVYSWLAVGVVGGWAAARTRCIWPSWISATTWNLILTMWVLSPLAKPATVLVTFDLGGGGAGFAATVYAQEVDSGETVHQFLSAGSHGLVVLPTSAPLNFQLEAPGTYVFYATLINNPDDYHYGATGCPAGADCDHSDLLAVEVSPGGAYEVTIADRKALLPTPDAPVRVPWRK